jgi:hypothetical protein
MIQGAHIFLRKRGETKWRFFTSSSGSDFRQILHYFNVFNQCFNEPHFLMEISVNRIIIAETSDQRRGEGGGAGGRIELTFL